MQKVFSRDENIFFQNQFPKGKSLFVNLIRLMQKVFLFRLVLITDFRRELNAMGPTLLFHGVEISQEI